MNSEATVQKIKRQIANSTVLLYMKGTPQFPQCGFSGRVVQILEDLNASYCYVNILENPEIRATLPVYAKWPTFPQLYVDGELIGGCDIVSELHQEEELRPLLEAVEAIAETEPDIVEADEA